MSVSGQRICRLAESASTADMPQDALRYVRELRSEIDDFERQQVARALTAGEPVSGIARALGVRRQSAHRRFHELLPSKSSARRLRSTPEVRLAVEYARRECEALGGTALGSGHLLLGLLRSGNHPVVVALGELGVEFDDVRTACEHRSCGGSAEESKAVLAAAARAARSAGADRVGIEHLLIGTLADPAGAAASLLRDVGVDPEAVAAVAASAG